MQPHLATLVRLDLTARMLQFHILSASWPLLDSEFLLSGKGSISWTEGRSECFGVYARLHPLPILVLFFFSFSQNCNPPRPIFAAHILKELGPSAGGLVYLLGTTALKKTDSPLRSHNCQ